MTTWHRPSTQNSSISMLCMVLIAEDESIGIAVVSTSTDGGHRHQPGYFSFGREFGHCLRQATG